MAVIYGNVSVTTAATLILAANSNRKGCIVANNDATNPIYIGPDTSITTSNSIPIKSGNYFLNSGISDLFRGAIYGIAGSSIDVRYMEWTQ